MANWKNISGSTAYDDNAGGLDIDVGWHWKIRNETGEERMISVEVAGGGIDSAELPEECRRAIGSEGWSAIVEHLDDDQPPRRIMVSAGGLLPHDA